MEATPGERVQGLMSAARALLEGGRPREAALLFGRVLLQDPVHEEARQGLVLARTQAGELDRELEERLQAAREAAGVGDLEVARALLAEVIRLGGDRDQARDLLDRLDDRGGLLPARDDAEPARAAPGPDAPSTGSPREWWSRTVFASVCAVAFAAVTTTVAASWDHLLGRLEKRPSPAAYAVSTLPLPAPPPGERALTEARRRLDQGDVKGALAALDHIRPDDPVYPFAVQLRQRAETAGGPAPDVGSGAPPPDGVTGEAPERSAAR
jgi:hypothetical protein